MTTSNREIVFHVGRYYVMGAAYSDTIKNFIASIDEVEHIVFKVLTEDGTTQTCEEDLTKEGALSGMENLITMLDTAPQSAKKLDITFAQLTASLAGVEMEPLEEDLYKFYEQAIKGVKPRSYQFDGKNQPDDCIAQRINLIEGVRWQTNENMSIIGLIADEDILIEVYGRKIEQDIIDAYKELEDYWEESLDAYNETSKVARESMAAGMPAIAREQGSDRK